MPVLSYLQQRLPHNVRDAAGVRDVHETPMNDCGCDLIVDMTVSHHRRFQELVLCIAAGAALFAAVTARAAAGSPPQASPAAPVINACTLLSVEQVAKATGFSIQSATRQDEGLTKDGAYSSTCVWKDTSSIAGTTRLAIVNAMTWPPGGGQAGRFLQSFRDAARDGTIPNAPLALTLGEESLWWGDGVAVKQGDLSFGMSVFDRSKSPPQRRAMEEELARQILQGLRIVTLMRDPGPGTLDEVFRPS